MKFVAKRFHYFFLSMGSGDIHGSRYNDWLIKIPELYLFDYEVGDTLSTIHDDPRDDNFMARYGTDVESDLSIANACFFQGNQLGRRQKLRVVNSTDFASTGVRLQVAAVECMYNGSSGDDEIFEWLVSASFIENISFEVRRLPCQDTMHSQLELAVQFWARPI